MLDETIAPAELLCEQVALVIGAQPLLERMQRNGHNGVDLLLGRKHDCRSKKRSKAHLILIFQRTDTRTAVIAIRRDDAVKHRGANERGRGRERRAAIGA